LESSREADFRSKPFTPTPLEHDISKGFLPKNMYIKMAKNLKIKIYIKKGKKSKN